MNISELNYENISVDEARVSTCLASYARQVLTPLLLLISTNQQLVPISSATASSSIQGMGYMALALHSADQIGKQ